MSLVKKGSVFTTVQTWYNKKYQKQAREYIELANKLLPHIREHLEFEAETQIVIKYIKSKRTTGVYYRKRKQAAVDPRISKKAFINVLVHELVHAQQYHKGQLDAEFNYAKRAFEYIWNGENYGKIPLSHEKYLALPWEVEARTIADMLTNKLLKLIEG
jgi:hypothetical protein